MRRRPLLTVIFVIAFLAIGIWYMTGGSTTGSVRQAEAAIRANPFPGNVTHPSVISVQCTQDGQPFFARLQHLIQPGDSAGQPAYWCVSFAPQDSSYTGPPTVAARFANQSCS